MSMLYGKTQTAASLAERAGSLSQFGGVRLVTLADGVERDMRMLQFNTGSGMTFSVLVDRAMDIAELQHSGRAVGWQSPTGFRHPGLHQPEDEQGYAWTRSFSGFLSTCGLDHILGPEAVPFDNYDHPQKSMTSHPLHGRVGSIPARLTGYGETWTGNDCVLWAEGVVIQAAVFGEVLHLHRRIEADLGGNDIRITDRVVNAGFSRTPHMFFYHFNIGHPVIDQGSRYLAPIREVVWATHAEKGLDAQGVGYQVCPGPRLDFSEQVWEHEMAADADGVVPVAVVNDALGFGIKIETRKEQLPCAYQWQNFRSGHYVMGLEPSTHHVKGNLFARSRDEMIWLSAGEERHYNTKVTVLDGLSDIADAEARISAIMRQPATDYPNPTGKFAKLSGSAGGKP